MLRKMIGAQPLIEFCKNNEKIDEYLSFDIEHRYF